MARADYNIHIRAHDAFSKGMLKAETAMNSMVSTGQKMQKNWLALGGTILAVNKAWDFAETAAQVDQQEQAFANLAASHGANSQQIIKNLDRMAAGTVSTAKIMESAGKAMLLGIPAERLTGMMEIARAASRVTGDTVQKSFDDIATGMGRQSKLILDNLGIIVKVEEANKEYARTMGIVGRQLTDAEKKQAFMNATLKAGEDIVARVAVKGLTASEAMAKFTATMQNLAVILGKVLISITTFGAGIFTVTGAMINDLALTIIKGVRKIIEVASKLPKVGKKMLPLLDVLKGIEEHQKAVVDEGIRLAKSQFEVGTSIWKTKTAVEGLNLALRETPEAAEEAKAKLTEAEKAIKRLMEQKGPGVVTAAATEFEGLETEQASMAAKMDVIRAFHENKIVMLEEFGATEETILQAQAEKRIAIEKQVEEAKIALKRNALGKAAGFFNNMASLSGKHSSTMLKLAKGAALAQATVDTIGAVIGAFKWGNTLGGPIVGAAFAAAAAAQGAVLLSQMSSAGGGGGGGGVASVPSSNIPDIPDRVPEAERQIESEAQVKIFVQNPITGKIGEEVADEIVDAINKAGKRNVKIEAVTVEGIGIE